MSEFEKKLRTRLDQIAQMMPRAKGKERKALQDERKALDNLLAKVTT